MVSMPVVGVTFSIDVIQAFRVLFSARKCQMVHDYGGFNMVHHKVLLKKPLHVHGLVKQVDDVVVQVVLSLTLVRLLAKVNKKQKVFSHNHFAHLNHHHHHRRLHLHRIIIQHQVQLDRILVLIYHQLNHLIQEITMLMHGILVALVQVQEQMQVLLVRQTLQIVRI